MRVSTTERQLFKRCRRKWNYSSYNRMSLTPIVNAPALDLGTLIHATLAEWTKDPTVDPNILYTHLSSTHLSHMRKQYLERVGCNPSPDELSPTLEAIMLGQHLIANYQTKWHTPLPPGYTLIENELTLIQPVQGTEHCTCTYNSCPGLCWGETEFEPACGCGTEDCDCPIENKSCVSMHELECTFDGVMADENGDLYIIERKTFARTPTLDELNNNDQFLAYQWALDQMYPGKVVGLAYDGLLKREKPPANKTTDDLFLRRILLRNRHELAEFGTLLAYELNEMANPNLKITKTVPAVQGCQRWECRFIDVCHATSKGEPIDDLMKMFVRSTHKKHLEIEQET